MPAHHARVAFEAHNTAGGAIIANVLHVEVDVLADPPNWTSVATDINTWLGTLWRNILSSADTFSQIVVTDENYPGSSHGQGVHVVGAAGARVPNDFKLDAALCAVTSWKTAVAKRYARGHTFWAPAYDTSAVSGVGAWGTSQAYWLAIQAFANAYVAGFTAGSTSYIPEVFSRHLVDTGVTPFTNQITGYLTSSKQHWLRSRSTSP